MRLVDLRLGFTPQDARAAEVLKEAHVLEFANKHEVEALPVNHEVVRAVQFLMNARAKREAMNRMDAGDFTGAQNILGDALRQTRLACAPLMSRVDVSQECETLAEFGRSLTDRLKDKMSRKKLAYQAYSRSTGRSG